MKAELRKGKAELLTNARKLAVADKWNTVSFAAMNHLMARVTERDLVINMDATQFRVGKSVDGSRDAYFVKEMRSEGKPLKLDEADEAKDGSMGFFIKYFLIMSAGGFTSVPVFVLASDKMPAEEMDPYFVKGLSIGTEDLNGGGWVVFCKTRTGNRGFFEWVNTKVLIQFIQNIRSKREIDQTVPAWFQLASCSAGLANIMSSRIRFVCVEYGHILFQ